MFSAHDWINMPLWFNFIFFNYFYARWSQLKIMVFIKFILLFWIWDYFSLHTNNVTSMFNKRWLTTDLLSWLHWISPWESSISFVYTFNSLVILSTFIIPVKCFFSFSWLNKCILLFLTFCIPPCHRRARELNVKKS